MQETTPHPVIQNLVYKHLLLNLAKDAQEVPISVCDSGHELCLTLLLVLSAAVGTVRL